MSSFRTCLKRQSSHPGICITVSHNPQGEIPRCQTLRQLEGLFVRHSGPLAQDANGATLRIEPSPTTFKCAVISAFLRGMNFYPLDQVRQTEPY